MLTEALLQEPLRCQQPIPAVLVLTTRLNCIVRNPSRRAAFKELWHRRLPIPWRRQFWLMPLMHSEKLAVQ